MWYFRSPEIVFGEDALDHLETLTGKQAFIITDSTMVGLGFVDIVGRRLQAAGITYRVFDKVQKEPDLITIYNGAETLYDYEADWIIALGGGSVMDAAKAIWILHENPGIDLEMINPFADIILRRRARLITIPTTSGTGSECTWAFVLTDTTENRKLGLGIPNVMPDIAIVDPLFPKAMPARLTADTGFDVLTQAIEGYTSGLHNDFSDGLCLKAISLVFAYLPRAVKDGNDVEAREKMHNAATLAGLGFGNSMAALAHALGHSLGAVLQVPHGRAVGIFLPYTIQYTVNSSPSTRFDEITRFLTTFNQGSGSMNLIEAIRDLAQQVNQPQTIADAVDISAADFAKLMPDLVEKAETDSVIAMGARIPTSDEIARLFDCAFKGQEIDF
ncbi:MAG: iron-containing alcohol dehydrogenase [Chloroflexota bacterium]